MMCSNCTFPCPFIGSETNTIYLYSADYSKPLLTYKFEDTNQLVIPEHVIPIK